MKKHTKIYMNYFGYSIADFIPCECCEAKAVDIHHIKSRGMGGSKEKDCIENLMALCRHCHITYGDITSERDYLVKKHQQKLNHIK
jgi:5-methylcytosine-specific restriction endonuclease McrA